MNLAVKIENLSKAYQLGQFNTGALSHDLERWWALIRGKEDPFMKIGETNDRSARSSTNVVWSLRDINLEIERGDVVGIIGKNGAGKSTLLKVLSRVTSPTRGSIKLKGRVASLLEVGTGFHKELTGRENVYLNGAILGMRKVEIRKRFDEIVEFAGVQRYIDTPVKRYSSGMYVRLAFAVAAHLESEILIVDEVLAVGDSEFQKKCIGKMSDISKSDGRTILFVSHNLDSVSSLCKEGVLLENGMIHSKGPVDEILKIYQSGNANKMNIVDIDSEENLDRSGKRHFGALKSFVLYNHKNEASSVLEYGQPFSAEISFELKNLTPKPEVGLVISNQRGQRFHHLVTSDLEILGVDKASYQVRVETASLQLYPGMYTISIWLRPSPSEAADDFVENITSFEVIQTSNRAELGENYRKNGGVILPHKWQLKCV